MPVVYIVAWLTAGGAGTGRAQLAVELAGFPIYATLAWLGLRRSPWLLVVGIAAHGIGWDAWQRPPSALPATLLGSRSLN